MVDLLEPADNSVNNDDYPIGLLRGSLLFYALWKNLTTCILASIFPRKEKRLTQTLGLIRASASSVYVSCKSNLPRDPLVTDDNGLGAGTRKPHIKCRGGIHHAHEFRRP
jgi:hypothetical protein